ncbi:hypothetical protein DQA24_11375 [Escherichia coli]|nr:hypothetical protein [Escherichia coli]
MNAPVGAVSFSTKQRRTPAVAAARMDWVMSPSSGDALLCFVKRTVPAGWVSTEGRLSASTLTRVR